ncbi:hypothetical protein K438DRAFT_1569743 [Mycena galopus ATCC 62051]|nr:hypothetical protein K438DRAFT_1569743 [Mycena galopus ATCC 62051]
MKCYSRITQAIAFTFIATFFWLGHRYPGLVAAPLSDVSLSESSTEANVDLLAPTLYPDHRYAWINENQKTMHALFRCIERGDCAQNQTKGTYHFIMPMEEGYIGGEAIWALSTIKALNNMGYSVLYARNIETAIQLYHQYANLITMVIANHEQIQWCFRTEVCGRTAANPAGIPLWKLFAFYFWRDGIHPLGHKWTLSPENYKTNNYLGYSIEAQCHRYPFVPPSERERQVYILAKFLKYFHPDEGRAWPPDFFDAAANATGASFIMASKESPEVPLQPGDLSTSIENIGPVNQHEFYDVLSHSVALVGVGNPMLSPTPYDALCLGIPFVNPIGEWDKKNPTDRTKWQTQHDQLKGLSAPYVYHVFKGDRDGFVDAIKSAVENPIESFVLERMKIESVEYRLGKMLEHDWRTEAEELLEARKAGSVSGDVSVFHGFFFSTDLPPTYGRSCLNYNSACPYPNLTYVLVVSSLLLLGGENNSHFGPK